MIFNYVLFYATLYASFRSHRWNQTRVTVWKRWIGLKIGIFCRVWPWNLMNDLEKNNRAPLLCYFKLCVSFYSHRWTYTGVIVRKHPCWVKIDDFLSPVTLKFDGWPFKNKMGISLKPHQTGSTISSPCGNSNWRCRPETVKFGFDLCDLDYDLWLDLELERCVFVVDES